MLKLPNFERVLEMLYYDANTGIFVWAKSPNTKMKVGSEAGAAMRSGYLTIKIDGQGYVAHRLAWLYVTANDPGHLLIDHINGDRVDNRFQNLRLVTHSQNVYNRNYTKNKTGFVGVSKCSGVERWFSTIGTGKDRQYLGTFASPELASAAYQAKAKELFGEFAYGKV